MKFDPATLLTTAFMTLLLFALVLATVLNRSRRDSAGLWWVVSFVLGASGFLLLTLFPSEPGSLVQISSNTLFLAAYGCCHAAARSLAGRVPVIWSVAVAAAVWPIVTGIFDPAFDMRVLICSTLISGYSIAAALEFACGAGRKERYRFMAAGLCAAHGLFYLVRAIWGPTLGFANAASEAVVSVWGAVIALEIMLFAAALATLVVAIALERAGMEARRAALTDHLTGVGNRRAFDSAMRTYLPATDHDDPTTLLLLDLDRFKEVNDHFGHEAGDNLLKAFAQAISKELPDPAMFWRLGGDEFAILVRGCEPHQVERLKDSLRNAVKTSKAFEQASAVVRVSVSIGSAAVIPGELAADLVRRADAALYQEKSKRRRLDLVPRRYRPVLMAACAAA